MSPPIEQWAVAFGLTCACELPIVVLLLRAQTGWARALAVAVAAQLMTHPILWFALPRFSPYWAWVTTAEIGIFLVEGALFAAVVRSVGEAWRPAVMRGLLVSTLANGLSLGVGLALQGLGWL